MNLRFSNGLLLLITLAAIGVLLVWIPPQMLDQYERISRLGPPWTYFYFAIVGTGAVILLGLFVAVVVEIVVEHAEEVGSERAGG